jgi:transposase
MNIYNADTIEKAVHKALLHLPQGERLFQNAGMGTARPKGVKMGDPFPCYCAVMTCDMSMTAAGLRRGTKEDKDKRKAKQAAEKVKAIQKGSLSMPSYFSPLPQVEEWQE